MVRAWLATLAAMVRSVRFILKETGSIGELEDNKPRVSPRISFASGAEYLVWE